MTRLEADRLHAGLVRAFAAVLPHIEGAWIEERPGYAWSACPAIPVPGFNGVLVDSGNAPVSLDDLRRAVEAVEGAGVPCWVQLRAGTTEGFGDAVGGLGFDLEDTIPGMALGSGELVGGPATTLEVTRVEDAVGLRVAAEVAGAGFEVPEALFAPIYAPRIAALPGVAVYVASVGGVPVSTAIGYTVDGSVGIFNVATPPAHRGHGYGRAVTERAIRDGFAAGADLAWLQASAMGESVYRAMGFRQVETYVVFGRRPGSSAT
jgi:ribosomal protein S18 acetylase RimI-like enzyme